MRQSLWLFFSYISMIPAAQAIDWKWVGETEPVVADAVQAFNTQGKPINAVNISDRLDVSLLDDFYGRVPEQQRVSDNLLNSTFNNISIRNDLGEGEIVSVKVAFLNEGAGYRNSLGYFIYQTDTPPTNIDEVEHVLIFPNTSKIGSGGDLASGDQIDLNINMQPGQSIGFFINSNGWDGAYGYQKSNLTFGQPFYTLTNLNPTVGLGQRYHVVFVDTRSSGENGSGFLAYGFEDILTSGGDQDFNDVIFSVEVDPISAVVGYEDAEVLPSVSEQIQSKSGVLAFEDNWPLTDDYDFNDAVIAYNIIQTYDAANNNESIKSIEIDYEIQAIGASFHNGLAVRIPGLNEDMIESITLEKTLNGITQTITQETIVTVNTSTDTISYSYPLVKDKEIINNDVSITLSEDLFEELSTFDQQAKIFDTYGCLYKTSNSPNACPAGTTAQEMNLTINLKSEVFTTTSIGEMPFDHYIFGTYKNDIYRFSRKNTDSDWFSSWRNFYSARDAANGPGPGKYLEIHLKQHAEGTSVFEPDFSISDYTEAVAVDAQNYNYGNPFISNQVERQGALRGNLPWALDLPSGWKPPKERNDINTAYPNFFSWAEDNTVHTDWYENNINQDAVFSE